MPNAKLYWKNKDKNEKMKLIHKKARVTRRRKRDEKLGFGVSDVKDKVEELLGKLKDRVGVGFNG